MARHFQKSVAIRVSDIYTYYGSKPSEFKKDMVRIFNLLAEGVLKPQITDLPLKHAAEAHRRLESGEITGKLVLAIS